MHSGRDGEGEDLEGRLFSDHPVSDISHAHDRQLSHGHVEHF